MGFWQQLTGQEGGSLIPGVDNPFHNSQTTWLPGAGQLNPLNSDSAVGKAVKDLGQLNVFNPDTTAGKVTQNIVADIGKDPVKWAAYAVAIAAGQPQLIPYISGAAKVTSKNSSPEEWLTEAAKAYVIQAGGEWVANNVAGLGPQTDITTGETFAGTGVRGATDSAMAARVAANSARGMLAAAAQKGSTDINGAQIITNSLTSDGLNQAMAQIPGWDTLSKAEQATAVNAFKVAFNRDQSAAYNLLNQGFTTAYNVAEKEAAKLGYNTLDTQVKAYDTVYRYGSAEDRELLNKTEQDYKTARARREELSDDWRNAIGDPVAQAAIDSEIDRMAGLQNSSVRALQELPSEVVAAKEAGWNSVQDSRDAQQVGIADPGLWRDYKTVGATNLTDYDTKKVFGVGDFFGTGEQATLYADGRVKDSDDAAPRALTADEAARINPTFPGAIPAKKQDVVDDLTNAGLHDDLDDTDLTEIVGGTGTTTGTDTLTGAAGDDTITSGTGTDTTTGATGTDTVAGGTGADTLTGGTGADTTTGATGDDTVAGGDPFAYYDPETKQYKYGANHGEFNPFNFGLTEEQFLSSSDPWAVYDPDTGQYQYSIGDPDFDPYKYDLVDNDPTNDYKYRLPNLPGGKKPDIRRRPTTTITTANANTATTAPTAPNMALFALLASLGNQQAPAPAPVIDNTPSEPFDFTSEFEVNPYAKQRSASKMAQGGSIDELLDILRRN